jgi:hypothetical protein
METMTTHEYASKLVKGMKLYADKISERHVAKIHGERHTLVPFAVEDGGRLGAYAHSFLLSLSERAVRQGRKSRTPSRDSSGAILRSDGATQVSLWVQWRQRHISKWPHLTMSRQLLFCPHHAVDAIFSYRPTLGRLSL